MPQETPKVIPLPEEVQNAINLAHAKIEVLRNEELRLNKLKSSLELDVASVSIKKDELDAEIKKLEESLRIALTNTVSAEAELARLTSSIKEANETLTMSQKQALEAEESRRQAEAKRAELMASIHIAETELETSRVQFRALVDAFNERKGRIQELLQTL